MKQWTVIWQPDDVDDYEYSYIECDEPFEFMNKQVINGVQNSTYDYSNEHYLMHDHLNVICVIEGHVGVNFP